MKTKVVLHTVGQILLIEAGLLLIPVVVGLIYHEQASVSAFLITIAITAAAGALLSLVKPGKSSIYSREGFAITGLSWMLLSFFGCLPFVISRQIPDFIDAFFETVSGFTTTGSSILTDIESLELHPLDRRHGNTRIQHDNSPARRKAEHVYSEG